MTSFNVINDIARRANSSHAGQMWRGITLRILEAAVGTLPLGLTVLALTLLWRDRLTGNILLQICVAMALAYLVQLALVWTSDRDTFSAGYKITGDLRLALADHIRRLPLGFFSRRHSGDLTSIVSGNVQLAEELFTHLVSIIAGGIAGTLVLAGVMLVIDWRLGLIMIATLPLGFGFMLFFRRTFERLTRAKSGEVAEAASRLLEYVQGIKLIRSFGLTGDKYVRLNDSLTRLRDLSIRIEIVGGMAIIGLGLILEAGFLVALVFGLNLYLDGGLDIPVLIAMLVLAQRFYAPVIDLTTFIAEATYIRRNMERIDAILNEPPLSEPEQPILPQDSEIEFKNVTFTYEDENEAALSDLSFTLPKGTITALVGPSGSGKSTLASLLLRFHDIKSGTLRVGGVPIDQIDSQTLHEHIATVFQDIYLFSGTIRENLQLARPDADELGIVAAAKAAQAHDFIMRLPDGYDTIVGEGGATLSGGERQRIAIAQALLKDAPVLILDEATASIDAENEGAIQQAIATLVQGRTTLVIAHRLASIVNADQILVLEKGCLVQQGSHQDLLEQDGLYARMWDASGMQ